MIAFFQRAGSIQGFTKFISDKKLSRVGIQLVAWFLGMFVFFSDYFSPLFVGSVMRNLSDKAKISREKLAYIADSTSAPVSVLMPITGWAVFISGLLIGLGPIKNQAEALNTFTKAVPLNFYAIIAVLMVGLISMKIIPEFGPMKKAEKRAIETGKIHGDNAEPLMGDELTDTKPYPGFKTHIFLNFLLPVIIVISIAISTFIILKSAKTMEAFMAASITLGIIMRIQGMPFNEIMKTAVSGIKGVMPAILILALSYSVNELSKEMGTAHYIISITKGWLRPFFTAFYHISYSSCYFIFNRLIMGNICYSNSFGCTPCIQLFRK